MYKLPLLFSLLITITINAKTETSTEFSNSSLEFITLKINQFELEDNLFSDLQDVTLNIEDIEVFELEEDIQIAFDTTEYLPKNFNVLAGKNDIDWSKVELIEIEEEIELGFDPKDYLPMGFNPYRGMDFKHEVVVCLN